MRNRFVITGAPGSGKTLVLRELVKVGFLGIDEPAREILAEQRAIGGGEEDFTVYGCIHGQFRVLNTEC